MFGDHHCLSLWDPAFLIYFRLQGLAVAVFDGHDLEVLVAVDVKALDEVGTVALIHQSGLRFAESLLDLLDEFALLIADCPEIHNLDGHLFFGPVIHGLVDLAI